MLFKFTIFIFFTFNLFAQDYESITYQVEDGDTLSKIFRKIVKDETVLNSKSPTVEETLKSNPIIKTKEEWKNLKKNTQLELRIERSIIDLNKYSKFKKRQEYREEDSGSSFKSSIFYMASMGNFKQTSNSYPNITFQQNSFLSLGYSASYRFTDTYFLSSSFYLSKLSATGSNLNENKVVVPDEIGFTFYGERKFKENNSMVYGGLDYDTFSSFNYPAVSSEDTIYVDKNKLYYLTLGYGRLVFIKDVPLFFKFSLSKSVISGHESTYANNGSFNGKLTGIKGMLYLNYKYTRSVFFHTLFKLHDLSGEYNLSSYRIGIGAGYAF